MEKEMQFPFALHMPETLRLAAVCPRDALGRIKAVALPTC